MLRIHLAGRGHPKNQKITLCRVVCELREYRPFSRDFLLEFDLFLSRINAEMIIKWHPKGAFKLDDSDLVNIKVLTASQYSLEETMAQSDILITDYSSIATDFALLDRPIIFFVPDFSEYVASSRGMYHDFDKVVPDPFVKDPWNLLELLERTDCFLKKDIEPSLRIT